MNSLPAWAQSTVARELLSAIIAEQPQLGPDTHKLPGMFGSHREPCEPQYKGKLAARLRRIRSEWLDREYRIRDAQFSVTGVWIPDGLDPETSDALIARMIREVEQERQAA